MNRSSLLTVLLPVVSIGCARIVAPGGGPEDHIPPELISLNPESGAGYSNLQEVVLLFSERLSSPSVEIPMYPSLPHRTRVSGSSIRIELKEPLGSGTIVLHIPSTISDTRGNRLESSTDLIYSGTDSIGSASIHLELSRQGGGSLYAGQVFADLFDNDSTLIRRIEPDSIGSASFRWLEPGNYRITCYEDLDVSFSWESETEAGVDTCIALQAGEELLLLPVLMVVDTTGPGLVDVESIDAYHVRTVYSEEVSTMSMSDAIFRLTDSSGEEVGIEGWWVSSGGRGLSSAILSTLSPMDDSTLVLRISGVSDLIGNTTQPDSMEFWGIDSLPADTLKVQSVYPEPGGENIPAGGPFSISFNFWIDLDAVRPLLSLTKVSDKALVEGTVSRISGRSFEFTPVHQLMGEEQHRIDLEPGLTTAWGDTLNGFSWTFSSAWGDEPGGVSGRIIGTGSDVIIQISHAGESGGAFLIPLPPGDYTADEITAGRYTVSAFVDRNSDGKWQPGESYGSFPGVVTVYPGLITEEVDVEILP